MEEDKMTIADIEREIEELKSKRTKAIKEGWDNFKQLVLDLRKLSRKLDIAFGKSIILSFYQETSDGFFEVNPLSVKLGSGEYYGKENRSGKFMKTNFKKWFKKDRPIKNSESKIPPTEA